MYCAQGFLSAALVVLAVRAQSPPQFAPAVETHLTVTYGNTAVNPAGITLPGTILANPPSLGPVSPSSGNYVAILMDFTVETTNSPAGPNTTLIHWIQGGFFSPSTSTTLSSNASAVAPYFPPGPPAGQTHTYGVFLYREPINFSVPADFVPFFANLTASVYNRVGFNLTKFVEETQLGSPVAADWFLVSTSNSTTTTSSTSGTPTKPAGTSAPKGSSGPSITPNPKRSSGASISSGLKTGVELCVLFTTVVGLVFYF